MNLKKLLKFDPPTANELIEDQLQKADRLLVQYTLEAEYAASMREFQRIAVKRLQELKYEISNRSGNDTNISKLDDGRKDPAIKGNPVSR